MTNQNKNSGDICWRTAENQKREMACDKFTKLSASSRNVFWMLVDATGLRPAVQPLDRLRHLRAFTPIKQYERQTRSTTAD